MTPSDRQRPHADEAARVASDAIELLEVLWGRASTAPVSTSQLRALFVLEHNDGINLRTLAESLDSTPPSMSRLCDRLQAMGLVDRTPSTTSRRELELHLSGRGRTFLADVRARRLQELQTILARMPATKRQALTQGLEALRTAATATLYEHTDAARSA